MQSDFGFMLFSSDKYESNNEERTINLDEYNDFPEIILNSIVSINSEGAHDQKHISQYS
jgi:hypothetical protein